MILAVNTSDRKLTVSYMGVDYTLPIKKPVNIPEEAARLYFAYGIDVDEDLANLCIDRLKRCNLTLFNLPNRDVWDNYIIKVKFNVDAVLAEEEPLPDEEVKIVKTTK